MTNKRLFLSIIAILCVFLAPNLALGSDFHVPQVKVYNSRNLNIDVDFLAFDENFGGGGRIALGDFDGNGYDEILVGSGRGSSHVRVFDKLGNPTQFSIFPFHPDFKGGVDVAAGDVDGDGADEIILSQLSGGQAWIKVYDYNGYIKSNFLAFNEDFHGGAYVAAGDVTGDGIAEIIVGAGLTGNKVKVFDGIGNDLKYDLYPYGYSYQGGVDVAVADMDYGKKAEIVTSVAAAGQARIKVYKYNGLRTIIGEFLAYGEDHQDGSFITALDIDKDEIAEIVTGVANSGGPHVRAFEFWGQPLNISFHALASDFRGGLDVTLGDLDGGDAKELLVIPSAYEKRGRTDLDKYIEVDLSEQKLYAYEKGVLYKEYLISSGLPGTPSPQGEFAVTRHQESKLYSGPGFYLPNTLWNMNFYGPYYIHGAYWHNNFGHPMSHGCINMRTEEAKIMYDFAPDGTKVIIHE
ncbi:MAG: L,D-transpeptidase family protein [bacterium]